MESPNNKKWIECTICHEYFLTDSVPDCSNPDKADTFHKGAVCGVNCFCDFGTVPICNDCIDSVSRGTSH